MFDKVGRPYLDEAGLVVHSNLGHEEFYAPLIDVAFMLDDEP